MKILRSILAIVIGSIMAMLSVGIVETIGHQVHPPPEGMSDPEAFKNLLADPEAMQRYVDSLPTIVWVAVLIAWQTGAFVGGAAAALIAGRAYCLHAGIVGLVILFASVVMMVLLPHPDSMKIAGLLMPLPVSLLAGKLVSLLFPPAEMNLP